MERMQTMAQQLGSGNNQSNNIFGHLQLAPPDAILGTTIAYKADKDPKKMNLGVGAYRDDNEKPKVFDIVAQVEKEIVADKSIDKEYLPIQGLDAFCKLSRELIFGADSQGVKQNRILTTQTISGSGALAVGFKFIQKHFNNPKVYVSKPTWGNHQAIITLAGLQHTEYPYYYPKTRGFDFDGMINCLKQAPAGSIILLHPCAHNPTGVDPSVEQWKSIAQVMKEGQLIPFFDSAYQGFASGDLIKDAFAIRMFEEMGFQMLVTQSFAKNMGLYGERVGAIHIVTNNAETANITMSQLKLVIRAMYSSPPKHGALIAARILGNKEYFQAWQAELTQVSHRIINMRELLRKNLEKLQVPGDWSHITNQIGMFSFTGLTPQQCEILINKFHIYLLKNGRISMCGVTTKNVEYLAQAINDAVRSTQ